MTAISKQPHLPSRQGEPAWEIALLYPIQGGWSESDFFKFDTNRMAELVDGRLEVLPVPTWLHQLIVEYLFDAMRAHVAAEQLGGKVMMAPLPVRLFENTIREPDLFYVREQHLPQDVRSYPARIDLAIEIVSEGCDARRRDYEDKRIDYAKAGVPEYWIVDPHNETVTVLVLNGTEYETSPSVAAGDFAISTLLPGLRIEMQPIWELGNSETPGDD